TNCYAVGIKLMPRENTNQSRFSMIIQGNAIGTILNAMELPSRSRILDHKCKENDSVRATRTLLALRAFQMARGSIPTALEELVPEFLESIPLDDFDGKPLRYSPASKRIYAVGNNLIDDGGVQSTNRLKTGDLVFPFKF